MRSAATVVFIACALLSGAMAQVARKTKTNPKDGLTYVWIPPGTFTMGCSPGDSECYSLEKPAHRTAITKGFWIGQTEVTQAAYGYVTRRNPSRFKGASLPVEDISWDDASTYCQAVGMRLPTEAEWEYAARGGNPAARYGTLDVVAWYNGNSGGRTHEVGQKQPNGYGLFDMLGNVSEWVKDWFDREHAGSSRVSDPQGPSSGQGRTLRGSSWNLDSRDTRVSQRDELEPANHDGGIGVRCAGDSVFPTGEQSTAGLPPPPPPHEENPAAKADSPTRKRIPVEAAVMQANLIHKVQPAYTPLARQAKIEGDVEFSVAGQSR
jgi:formylglycine-generating enzyme required for sulfatase activity